MFGSEQQLSLAGVAAASGIARSEWQQPVKELDRMASRAGWQQPVKEQDRTAPPAGWQLGVYRSHVYWLLREGKDEPSAVFSYLMTTQGQKIDIKYIQWNFTNIINVA